MEQEIYYRLKPLIGTISRDKTLTTKEISEYAEILAQPVLDGATDPIGLYAEIRIVQAILSATVDMIEDAVQQELQKYTKGQLPTNTYGAKLEMLEGTRQYDFKNNPSIVSLQEKIKELQDIAKVIKEPMVNEATGEMIYPANVSYKKASVKFTIKKS